MKKLSILLSLLFCFTQVAFAENANQEINIEQNKAVVSVQKQPINETSAQKQNVKSNWFCIIIQVNGKTPFDKTENK